MAEIIFDKGVDPDAVTAFIREIPTPATHALGQFFPDVTQDSDKVELRGEITKRQQTSGFRAVDGDFQSLDRDGWTTKEMSMMFLGNRMNISEFERLRIEAARQLGGGNSALVNQLYDDVATQVKAVRNRTELALGEIMTTGKLVVSENRVITQADFGVPADHFVSAGTPWTDMANADVLDDLQAWADKYQSDAGYAPAGMVLSKKTVSLLLRNAQILNANLYGHPQGSVPRVSRAVLDSLLAENDLPPIALVYDTKLPKVDETIDRVIPEDKVIFVPPAEEQLGRTVWGLTATALELMGAAQTDSSFASSPGLVGVLIKTGPPFKQETFVDGRMVPVLDNPNGLFVADVY